MSSSWITGRRRLLPLSVFSLTTFLTLCAGGCTQVAGNYPSPRTRPVCDNARYTGKGFQLLAGSSLRLDQVEAELDQLKSQGYSRRDPQIIKSVARRKQVPVALLADRSGNSYYRFTARLDPGTCLSLTPGALKVTVMTRGGPTVVHDRGYLLEDRRVPGGCRSPLRSTLAFRSAEDEFAAEREFLVRLPVRGEIMDLDVVPRRFSIALK